MKVRSITALVALGALACATPAAAHHPEGDGVVDPMQMLSAHHQHGGEDGHLPAVQRNVAVLGTLDLFGADERPGRVSDVGVFGDYAYLGAFREPDCEDGGVYVLDISDPAAPREAGFIPTSPFTYVGEGVQVLDMSTEHFTGQVLIHNNENCSPVSGAIPAGAGGTSLWDVTDPTDPEPLARHVGDTDPAIQGSLPHTSLPHQSHSAFGWQQGDRAYVVMVDNAELGNIGAGTDVDILDITDPRNPELIVETGLPDFPGIVESPAPNGNNAFLHDMVVKRVGDRYLLLGSYWDGGYIVLDVTNLPEKPTFLRDTDFGPQEPFASEMGLSPEWTPEGNAHQAEFNRDSTMFLGADEDFGARRVVGTITSGALYAGDVFTATQGNNVPQIDDDTAAIGPTTYVGEACTPLPPAASDEHVAVVARGTCTFTVKAQNVQAAGYQAGIVFNNAAECDAQVNMDVLADIPFVFVGRTTGMKLLERPAECTAALPPPLTAGNDVDLSAVFDGWGYLHLYDAQTMEAIDHWALPESLQAEYADGFGDLSIHEVAMDSALNRAYVSHYAGGFRVFDFSRDGGLQEVGAYIDPAGNNFWGVEVHSLPDAGTVVLASDRDSGLWIFKYTGKTKKPKKGAGPRVR
jgi:hypothetical protein